MISTSTFLFGRLGCLRAHTTRLMLANNEQHQPSTRSRSFTLENHLGLLVCLMMRIRETLSGGSKDFQRATYACMSVVIQIFSYTTGAQLTLSVVSIERYMSHHIPISVDPRTRTWHIFRSVYT